MYRLKPCSIDASVPAASVCMGFICSLDLAHAQSGGTTKTPRCALCNHLLSGKSSLPHGDSRKCKPRCRSTTARVAPAASVAASSVAAAANPAAAQASSLPAPAISPSRLSAPSRKPTDTKQLLPPLLLHDTPTLLSHCWSLRRFCRRSCVLASKWMDLIKSGELNAWEEKRGKFWQLETQIHLECSHVDQLRVSLRSGTESFFRQVLRAHTVAVTPCDWSTSNCCDAHTRKGCRRSIATFPTPPLEHCHSPVSSISRRRCRLLFPLRQTQPTGTQPATSQTHKRCAANCCSAGTSPLAPSLLATP